MALIPFVRVRKTPTALGGLWVQELHRPRLGHGLWQRVTEPQEREEINLEQKHFPDTQRDRQTDRPAAAGASRASGRVGGGGHAAKPLGGRSGERRQVPPHGAEAPGSASVALTVGAPVPRRGGGGDVLGGQGREMGQLGGWGAEPPPRCTEGTWKGSRQQLQGWCGVSGCPVPRSPQCPPPAHWLQWGAPRVGPRQSPPLGCRG